MVTVGEINAASEMEATVIGFASAKMHSPSEKSDSSSEALLLLLLLLLLILLLLLQLTLKFILLVLQLVLLVSSDLLKVLEIDEKSAHSSSLFS